MTVPRISQELPSKDTLISLYYLPVLQSFKENMLASSLKENHCFVKMGFGVGFDLYEEKRMEIFYFHLLQTPTPFVCRDIFSFQDVFHSKLYS